MKKQDEYKFSKRVNDFIDSLKKHNATIKVETNDDETIIWYESYDHEPIRNYKSILERDYTKSDKWVKARDSRKGVPLTPETRQKISDGLKGKVMSEANKMKKKEQMTNNNPMKNKETVKKAVETRSKRNKK